eukprot:3389302-Rhodomonas_salina.1
MECLNKDECISGSACLGKFFNKVGAPCVPLSSPPLPPRSSSSSQHARQPSSNSNSSLRSRGRGVETSRCDRGQTRQCVVSGVVSAAGQCLDIRVAVAAFLSLIIQFMALGYACAIRQ